MPLVPPGVGDAARVPVGVPEAARAVAVMHAGLTAVAPAPAVPTAAVRVAAGTEPAAVWSTEAGPAELLATAWTVGARLVAPA